VSDSILKMLNPPAALFAQVLLCTITHAKCRSERRCSKIIQNRSNSSKKRGKGPNVYLNVV